MKFITHLYAIITCFILTIFVIAFIIITLPISIIGNCVRLICALLANNFGKPGYGSYIIGKPEYASWIIFCREGFLYIKGLYYCIINYKN